MLDYVTVAPCHNDLHPRNLCFFENEFKAFDYGTAGPGEPYLDVLSVLAYFHAKSIHEKILLTAYLGRSPSAADEAKLYLMAQAVLIRLGFDALGRLSPEDVHRYDLIQATEFKSFFNDYIEWKIDLSEPENNLKLLKIFFTQVLNNFESQEFKNVLGALKKQYLRR